MTAGEEQGDAGNAPQARGDRMITRVIFDISASVMAEPGTRSAPGFWKRVTETSKELLRPIRDALIASGMKVSEPGGGKPWGSGFTVGEGPSRVDVFFFPYMDEDRDHCWVGDIRITEVWPWWTFLTMGYTATPEQIEMIGKVTAVLETQLEANPAFTNIQWNPPEKDEH